ncbi:hypothetical protein [Parashewanella tropica]|uniref:hypothetical protein n=1 Tax=Parashewanella tropica TaxID=2547970 RepID=UPI001059C5E4|nr:hypothetical protein [Parashewanella tropica]
MKFLKLLIIKPLEGYLHLTAWLIFAWLYFQIVFAATALFCMFSLVSFYFLDFDTALNVVYGVSAIGFIAGIFWAESIRKKHGIITFHAYLLSTPEIEGWRDKDGNVIKRR